MLWLTFLLRNECTHVGDILTWLTLLSGIDERADVELKRPRRDEVKAGTDVILKCVITGNPDPTILWYHNKFRSVLSAFY